MWVISWGCISLGTWHNKVASGWLIPGPGNPDLQAQAPDFFKSHFGAKRVGNAFFFVCKSTKIIPIFLSDRQNM